MPTYVMECDAGHNYEVIQRITEEPYKKCTHIVTKPEGLAPCGAPCRRIPQPAGILLKGGGWANDGYARKP